MKRKVIKQGNGTLTITLPKKWTRQIGLTGDSEINIETLGNKLLIKSTGSETGKRTNIVLESNNLLYVKQILRNIYLSGYDEVYVQYFDNESIIAVNEAIDWLIGYHIIEQTKKGCLIKSLSPMMDEQFSVLLRKVFLLNKSMFEMLLGDLKENNISNIKSIKGTAKNIHRFGDYCRRTIIKKHIFGDFESTGMYLLIIRLIACSHNITYIYEQLPKGRKKHISKECLDFVKRANEYYLLFHNLYYERKLKDIYRLSVLKDELLNRKLPSLLIKNNEDNIIIHHAAQIIRDIARNGGILFTLKQKT